MVVVSVIYPRTSQSRFDVPYYVQQHMPLVQSRWSSLGLEKYQLLLGKSALDGAFPSLAMTALLTFSSEQDLQAALARHGAEILADIPNFTDVQPVIQINEQL